jgi:hypothetical protein
MLACPGQHVVDHRDGATFAALPSFATANKHLNDYRQEHDAPVDGGRSYQPGWIDKPA